MTTPKRCLQIQTRWHNEPVTSAAWLVLHRLPDFTEERHIAAWAHLKAAFAVARALSYQALCSHMLTFPDPDIGAEFVDNCVRWGWLCTLEDDGHPTLLDPA